MELGNVNGVVKVVDSEAILAEAKASEVTVEATPVEATEKVSVTA